MGAEFFVSHIEHKEGVELDWDAARPAIEAIPDNEFERAIDQTGKDIRGREGVVALFAELKELIDGGYGRDWMTTHVGEYVVYVSGGLSWGDDPTDECGLFWSVAEFPTVLKAIGFHA
jgi:hypothetical protein